MPKEKEDTKKVDEDNVEEVTLEEGIEKTVKIGKELNLQVFFHLILLLKQNAKLFAYSAANMLRIDPETITHKLNVLEGM